MHARPILAVQYVRASSGLQGCSIEQQIAAISSYAALRGFEIVETYSDDALSGLTLDRRPALQKLLVDTLATGRHFEAILVYDVSRWGRFQDIDHGAHLEFICRRAGVSVHYCAEPFENDGSPEADLIKQIKRAIAAEVSRATSQRISLAKTHINGKGFYASGGVPFAMQRQVLDPSGRVVAVLEPGEVKVAANHHIRLVPGPTEAKAIVQAIFRLYVVDGLKLSAIAEQLNRTGAPSPSGIGWTPQRLRRLMRNEAYAGVHIYGRTRHNLGHIERRAPMSWQRIPNAWQATVPRWMFDKAQELMDDRARRSDERMLDDLRALLNARGRLDTGLISHTDGVRSVDAYVKRFGSLSAAYRLIGYKAVRRP